MILVIHKAGEIQRIAKNIQRPERHNLQPGESKNVYETEKEVGAEEYANYSKYFKEE